MAAREEDDDPVAPRTATLTRSQQARRNRMLEVTAELALEGGWDAVQMREVAQRADVALGTLYRYFPSKEFLLVSVMIAEIEGLADRLAVRPPQGEDPVERVIDVLRRANRALQRQPQVTIAMIRALVSGNQEIAPAVDETRSLMRRIISDALGLSDGEHADESATDRRLVEGHEGNGADAERADEPVDPGGEAASANGSGSEPADQLLLGIDLLSDVWLAALVSWISGVEPASSIVPKLSGATRMLLG